jgi:recombination protein RecT
MTTQNNQVAKVQPTASERFSQMVVREFAGQGGTVNLTAFQKRLVQNYFIHTDIALKTAEERRLKKAEKYRDDVPVTWKHVNMPQLAINVVSCARIGFDPALANHINMVPYKNNQTGKYDIGFLQGYRGKELLAMKYGFRPPDDVIVEVVYKNDIFKPVKKDKNNQIEEYIFEIPDWANRGEIIGGFYYHLYRETPEKNKLVFMTKVEIDKRKPEYASSEFWGGERDVWKDGKKAGKETIEGWYPEMVYKTIYRAAYGAITIDSQKIDDDFIKLSEQEREFNHGYDKNEIIIPNTEEAIDISIDEGPKEEPKKKVKAKAKKLNDKEPPPVKHPIASKDEAPIQPQMEF